MAVFWDVAPCSLEEIDQRFRGVCCLHHQGDEKVQEDQERNGKWNKLYTDCMKKIKSNRNKGAKSEVQQTYNVN
jgi:hypothetical protein